MPDGQQYSFVIQTMKKKVFMYDMFFSEADIVSQLSMWLSMLTHLVGKNNDLIP